MTRSNVFASCVLAVLLTGCSSPPEPPQPGRSAKSETVNDTMPLWEANNITVPAGAVSGHWQIKLADFRGNNDNYPPAFWFGITHSSHIMVAAGRGTDWYGIKGWLRARGANQVIEYRLKPGCYNCADIYLSR